MAHEPRPHWLYTGARTRSCEVILSFDTETTSFPEGADEHLILRCWTALTRIRHDAAPGRARVTMAEGTEPGGLCDVVAHAATITGEAWAFAHNLGFDLTVTALPFLLIERGWHLDAFHLGEESCWWILSQEDRKLVLTDSWSWVRCSLEEAARDLRRRKLALPANDAGLSDWLERCAKDTRILDEVMVTILDWWDQNELGRFSITGAGCGWAAMRQHVRPRTVLVGPDGERTAFERRAVHGGRKEAYQLGRVSGTWCADNDFVSAYCVTAAHLPLPMRPVRPRAPATGLLGPLEDDRFDYIAEVEITTHRPCAPARIGDDTWWPVGRFRTTLCGPEVRYAATIADRVSIGRVQWYAMGDGLAEWGRWCQGLVDDKGQRHPAVVSRMAKGWGRSVIGRFAGRTSRVVADRPATRPGWFLETGHDLEDGSALEVVTIGGRELTIKRDVDAVDCSPAIFAFVEAHCRVALGRVLEDRPPHKLLQANTDGWWEKGALRRVGATMVRAPWPYQIARKAIEREVVIIGPNHVVTPHERRLSGVPSSADMDDDGSFHFHTWPSMRWQLEHSRPQTFIRPTHAVSMADHYARRWALEGGDTIPVTTTVDADGQNVICPWSTTWGRRPGDRLAPVQVDELRGLADEDGARPDGALVELPAQPGRSR